jgi:glutamate 5-kinase
MKSQADPARKSLSALQGGEGGDPLRSNGEGEVGVGERSGIPHLTPTLSAPEGGEEVTREPTPAAALAAARRLVVKIGSALLVDEDGEIHRAWLDALVDDLARCRGRDQDVIVVSSGAIAVGRRHLGLRGRALRLEEKQAAAATGQIRLAHAYQEALARHHITVAQILLTLEDTEERRRHLNARATFAQLLGLGAVPVVNENDTIATTEIRFGDNDRLAARVAQMASADMLVLLSDIDGLYSADPRHDSAARHIPLVHEIGLEIEAMAGSAPPGYSSGGMVTKLAAARIAMQAGCHMLIAEGRPKLGPGTERIAGPLAAIEAGARATLFLPHSEPRSARKAWIAGAVNPAGALIVDDGAVRALRSGKSLLPAGVIGVEGAFDRGDCVIIRTRAGIEAGRGLSAYTSGDIRHIAGHKSGEIATILGYRGRDEIIHRDDLVLTEAR